MHVDVSAIQSSRLVVFRAVFTGEALIVPVAAFRIFLLFCLIHGFFASLAFITPAKSRWHFDFLLTDPLLYIKRVGYNVIYK